MPGAPGGTSETQAWILGDRLAYVAFDRTTYRLTSVDARGLDPKTYLESTTAIYGQNPNGTGIYQGRMCFTRGNDLLLLDPTGTAPAVLRSGSTPTYFSGWTRDRVLFSFQEGTTYPLWSARIEGGDRRQLSANGSPFEVR